ncbi:DNA mismatch repair endonuclease MutL [Dysosmobacter sp.]|uniref:DNA mismatch repair endonuclease MutL n=1 Tax=Dysosmobacter sp. TaxID=2591382 RepID=UPI002A9486D4|nr:DNA mismatch repair endonuclease MutL [Dysosmobacter sp.]MCI6055229.1 DNA mismatch repair endonuclease MutL [Dysosmobacter sp.]MDY5509398.1 DNA mismatch repair endonuclease MutL [Dysosmobacter sp.]
MPHIQQLDSHVADLIAAGEVVERPASVVKELVENAIDAGSSAVVVEIRRGGMALIRVTDNGCGIAPEELPTAFLRHATSKLRTEEDLGKIGTLGFRGEALAAISAVSRVDIVTCRPGAAEGASLHLEGGEPAAVEAAGAPQGTTIVVRDLFYNTPARLKFMRKDSAETAAVGGLMQHLALSHPDISFKFIKDGQEALHTPGDGKLDSAVYAALGRDFAHGLVPVEGRGGETAVSGFVTGPLQGRGSRSMQVFFVNGRFIKSQLLTAALEEGYRNQIMKGKFPGCVLSVTLPVTAVDVNVHPAKTQVKFAREREVFDAVYHTVLDALDSRGAANAPAARRETVPAAKPDFFQTMDARTFREQAARQAERPAAPARPAWNTEQRTSAPVADSGTGGVYQSAPQERKVPAAFQRTPIRPLGGALGQAPSSVTAERREAALVQRREMVSAPAETEERTPETRTAAPEPSVRPFVPAIPEMAPQAPEQVPGQTALDAGEAPWRIAGEVLNTYIICEDGSGNVWLIDKHAAHERINFDRLMAAQEPPMRQTLLSPVAAELGREDGALLLENLPLLEQLGFSCEDFGGGAVLVREVPADIDPCDVSATLEELAECLRTGRSPDERRENLLHTMACKAAIKGGWKSDPAELRVLVEKVQSGAVRFCPHGRPVAVKLTKYELEKMFKRA